MHCVKILGFLIMYSFLLDISSAVNIGGCFTYNSIFVCLPISPRIPQFIEARINGYQAFELRNNYFQHWRLSSFPSKTFSNFRGLKQMYLSSIGLRYLKCDIFNYLKDTLEGLALNNNELVQIQQCTFRNLYSLRILNLYNNKIQDLGESPFFTLSSLEDINLSGNSMTEITENTFKVFNISVLKHMYLSGNQLYSIHINAFVQHENLTVLDLSYNKLTSEVWKSLTSLKLKTLNLAHNKIQSVDSSVLNHFDMIEELDLSNNGIQSLSNVYFRSGVLRRISLANNKIGSIAADFFSPSKTFSTTSMVTIDISHNILKSLHVNLPECKQNCHVYLQNNLLNKLTFSYTGENKVYIINVENNNLTELSDTIPLAKHQHLSHNPLSSQSALAFLQTKLADTERLYMSNISLFCNEQQNVMVKKRLINSSNIEIMDFSKNCIQEDFVCMLAPSSRSLILNFDFNSFTELPGCLNTFDSNTVITIRYNQIVHLNFINETSSLYDIDLEGNMIQEIPFLDNVTIRRNLKLNNNQLSAQSNLSFVFMPLRYEPNCNVDLSNNSIDTIENMNIKHVNNSFYQLCSKITVEVSNTSLSVFPNISIQCYSSNIYSTFDLVFQNNTLEELKAISVQNCQYFHISLFYGNNNIKEISEPLLLFSGGVLSYFIISVLDLSNNLLSTYPECHFILTHSSNTYIGGIILANNQITNMPGLIGDDYCYMKTYTLILDSNKIKRIPSVIGEEIPLTTRIYLSRLSINHNSIEYITDMAFSKLVWLNYLDLSSNLLNDVPSSVGTLSNLYHLDLSSNILKNLPTDLSALKSLNHLDLSSNLLKLLPANLGGFKNLGYLNMASNQLTLLDKDLKLLTNLKVLDVSNNQIIDFTPDLIRPFAYNLPSIKINLNNNPIHCSCSTAWLRDFSVEVDNARCESPSEYNGYFVKCFPIQNCNERFDVNPTEQTLHMCLSKESVSDMRININYRVLKEKVLVSWTTCQHNNVQNFLVVSKKNGIEIFRSDRLNSYDTSYSMIDLNADEICVLAMNGSFVPIYVKCINFSRSAENNSSLMPSEKNTSIENHPSEEYTESRILIIVLSIVAALSICGNLTFIVLYCRDCTLKQRTKKDNTNEKQKIAYADNIVELEEKEINTSSNYERTRRAELVESSIYEELDKEEI